MNNGRLGALFQHKTYIIGAMFDADEENRGWKAHRLFIRSDETEQQKLKRPVIKIKWTGIMG